MGDYTIAISFIGLLAYLEWRVVPLLIVRPNVTVESATLVEEKMFTCHYCGRRFPFVEQEKVGNYTYCKEHGAKRQKATPPARPNGKAIHHWYTAWAKKVDDEPMPWEK